MLYDRRQLYRLKFYKEYKQNPTELRFAISLQMCICEVLSVMFHLHISVCGLFFFNIFAVEG